MAIIEVKVTDVLVIAEILGTNQHVIAVTDTLNFRQSGDDIPLHQSVHQFFPYYQYVTYSLTAHRSITQTLEFTQGAFRNQVGYVYQNLTFHQTGDHGQFVTDTLDFIETVVGANTNGVIDTLEFTETVTTSVVYNRSVTDTLVFDSHTTGFLPKPEFINAPVTVPNTPTPSPTTTTSVPAVPAVNPNIYFVSAVQYAATVRLTSPRGLSITLKAPDFGNTDEIGQTRIQRQTRGGDFIVWRAPYWPTAEEFSLTFSYLNEDTVSRLQAVIQEAVGQLYTYVDHEGVSWQVVITTPELKVTNPGYPQVTFKLMVVKEADA